jgi:GrpB-like predicted nucleotidyltransferase (UPF0157 family)
VAEINAKVQSERISVELVPHSPVWAEMARSETARLKAVLGDNLLTVHHIGSTAIPGIKAKPIVDLMPIVADLVTLDAREQEVAALGYEWMGEFGLPGRRYCRLNDPVTGKRKFQLHCYEDGAGESLRHVAFRDYLRAHPEIARAYEAQKERAASLHPDDVLKYNDAKNDWIKATEKDALAWYAKRA